MGDEDVDPLRSIVEVIAGPTAVALPLDTDPTRPSGLLCPPVQGAGGLEQDIPFFGGKSRHLRQVRAAWRKAVELVARVASFGRGRDNAVTAFALQLDQGRLAWPALLVEKDLPARIGRRRAGQL